METDIVHENTPSISVRYNKNEIRYLNRNNLNNRNSGLETDQVVQLSSVFYENSLDVSGSTLIVLVYMIRCVWGRILIPTNDHHGFVSAIMLFCAT